MCHRDVSSPSPRVNRCYSLLPVNTSRHPTSTASPPPTCRLIADYRRTINSPSAALVYRLMNARLLLHPQSVLCLDHTPHAKPRSFTGCHTEQAPSAPSQSTVYRVTSIVDLVHCDRTVAADTATHLLNSRLRLLPCRLPHGRDKDDHLLSRVHAYHIDHSPFLDQPSTRQTDTGAT